MHLRACQGRYPWPTYLNGPNTSKRAAISDLLVIAFLGCKAFLVSLGPAFEVAQILAIFALLNHLLCEGFQFFCRVLDCFENLIDLNTVRC